MNESNELTYEETAQTLGVSVQTVYELVRRGVLEKHKRAFGRGHGGRRFYFLKSDVDELARGDKSASDSGKKRKGK